MRKILLLLLLSLNSYAINYPITPKSIEEQFSQKGFDLVLTEIFNNQSAANMVLLAIDSGNKDWLKMAVKIHQNSKNPQTKKMIEMSLGEALQWQPENVFSIVFPSIELKKICSLEGIYEWRLMSQFLAKQAILRRQNRLKKINDFKYSKVIHLCQKRLSNAKKMVNKNLSNLP